MKILIADDDEAIRSVLEVTLVRWGHEVVACADGVQAWEALQREDAPKLAILDWMMPGMEGVEVCRRVRKLPRSKQIYILLLTSKGDREDTVAGLEAGADDYITKPFDRQELHARVQVGQRILELQEQLLEGERVKVLAAASVAAAHHINQPLTVIVGMVDLLSKMTAADDLRRPYIESVGEAGERISEIVKQMVAVRQYVTTPYLRGIDMVDFDAASQEGEEREG